MLYLDYANPHTTLYQAERLRYLSFVGVVYQNNPYMDKQLNQTLNETVSALCTPFID